MFEENKNECPQTLVLKLQYDGSEYFGWQIQPNTCTIQECIENALKKLIGKSLRVIGAGRTDAGVHAREQVAHSVLFKGFPIPENKIKIALNTNLPKDIRIDKAIIVNFEFNARFDAIAREYSYSITNLENVFNRNFVTLVHYNLDFEIMNKTAELFLGKHDFTSFSKYNLGNKNYICDVLHSSWEIADTNNHIFHIKANRFVYGMVRLLVGAMLNVARGKKSISDIENALNNPQRLPISTSAPAQGLVLEKIYYPKELIDF